MIEGTFIQHRCRITCNVTKNTSPSRIKFHQTRWMFSSTRKYFPKERVTSILFFSVSFLRFYRADKLTGSVFVYFLFVFFLRHHSILQSFISFLRLSFFFLIKNSKIEHVEWRSFVLFIHLQWLWSSNLSWKAIELPAFNEGEDLRRIKLLAIFVSSLKVNSNDG